MSSTLLAQGYNTQSANNIMIPEYYTQYNVSIAAQQLRQTQMNQSPRYYEQAIQYTPTKYNMATVAVNNQYANNSNTQYNNHGQYQYQNQYQNNNANQYTHSQSGLYNSLPIMINPLLRTLYIGNLPNGITYEELLNHVRGGRLDNVKIFEDKNYAFVTFVEASAAVAFYQSASTRRITIHNQDAKIGWGKPVQISPNILLAVQNNASRNIFIGNLNDTITEHYLQEEFSRFGPIDVIKVLPEKRIAFVHMTSIAAAMKAIQTFQNEERWIDHRINYGNDRCALPVKLKNNGNSMLFGGNNGNGMSYPYNSNNISSFPSVLQMPLTSGNYPNIYSNSFKTVILNSNPSFNRTVYLGGLGSDVSIKDICDSIRGGILQEIKYKSEGNCAFVTFVDPNAATSFFNRVSSEGIIIKGKRISKVGWGKHPSLSQHLSTAIQNGATRNVYIGMLDDDVTEETLQNDFSEYGEIELINLIPEKRFGFINFTSIKSAVKAVESQKNKKKYEKQKISYGKDRCGNAIHERSHNSNNNDILHNFNKYNPNSPSSINSPSQLSSPLESKEMGFKNI